MTLQFVAVEVDYISPNGTEVPVLEHPSYADVHHGSPLVLSQFADRSLVGPSDRGCLNQPSSGILLFPPTGLDVPVSVPNTTWRINGITLTSLLPVANLTHDRDGVGFSNPASWTGMGVITLRAGQSTKVITEHALQSIWALLGNIAGVHGSM